MATRPLSSLNKRKILFLCYVLLSTLVFLNSVAMLGRLKLATLHLVHKIRVFGLLHVIMK